MYLNIPYFLIGYLLARFTNAVIYWKLNRPCNTPNGAVMSATHVKNLEIEPGDLSISQLRLTDYRTARVETLIIIIQKAEKINDFIINSNKYYNFHLDCQS